MRRTIVFIIAASASSKDHRAKPPLYQIGNIRMVEENDQMPLWPGDLVGQSILNVGDNGANSRTKAAETELGEETLDSAVNLDKEDRSLVLSVDSNEVSTGDLGDLGLELGHGGSLGNDVSDGTLDISKVKAAQKPEDRVVKLNKEVLATSKATVIGDGEDILEMVGALEVAKNGLDGANNGADEVANRAETEVLEKIDNRRGELNQNSVTIVENGGDLGDAVTALVKLVDGISGLNDLADRLLESVGGQLAHDSLELRLGLHLEVGGSGLVEDGQDLARAGVIIQVSDGAGGNGQSGGGCRGARADGDERCHGRRNA